MIKVKQINTIYVMIAFFLFIAICIAVFLLYPTLRDIQKSSAQILLDRAHATFIENQNKNFYNFQENYKDYQPSFQATDKLFIDSQNPVDFIKFMENVSADSSVTTSIDLIHAPDTKNATGSSSSFFKVSAKGDLFHIMEFIEKLETGPYLSKIQSLTMRKVDQQFNKEKNPLSQLEAEFLVEAINK